jgi:hypothetical protein
MQKLQLRQIVSEHLLPGGSADKSKRGRVEPGVCYWCKDTKRLLIGMADGCLLDVAELLSGEVAHCHVPTPGRDGKDGRDGRDGVDGQSIVGPQGLPGPQGPPGDITLIGNSELIAACRKLKAQKAAWLAALKVQQEISMKINHPLLRAAVNGVLRTLEKDSNA